MGSRSERNAAAAEPCARSPNDTRRVGGVGGIRRVDAKSEASSANGPTAGTAPGNWI